MDAVVDVDVERARAVAEQELVDRPQLLAHTATTSVQASRIAAALGLPSAQQSALVAAAWLHEVASAPMTASEDVGRDLDGPLLLAVVATGRARALGSKMCSAAAAHRLPAAGQPPAPDHLVDALLAAMLTSGWAGGVVDVQHGLSHHLGCADVTMPAAHPADVGALLHSVALTEVTALACGGAAGRDVLAWPETLPESLIYRVAARRSPRQGLWWDALAAARAAAALAVLRHPGRTEHELLPAVASTARALRRDRPAAVADALDALWQSGQGGQCTSSGGRPVAYAKSAV